MSCFGNTFFSLSDRLRAHDERTKWRKHPQPNHPPLRWKIKGAAHTFRTKSYADSSRPVSMNIHIILRGLKIRFFAQHENQFDAISDYIYYAWNAISTSIHFHRKLRRSSRCDILSRNIFRRRSINLVRKQGQEEMLMRLGEKVIDEFVCGGFMIFPFTFSFHLAMFNVLWRLAYEPMKYLQS